MSAQGRTYEDGVAAGKREAEVAALREGFADIQRTLSGEVGRLHERLDEIVTVRCEPRGARLAVLESATRRIWWMIGLIVAGIGGAVGLLVRIGYSMGAL